MCDDDVVTMPTKLMGRCFYVLIEVMTNFREWRTEVRFHIIFAGKERQFPVSNQLHT